MKKLSILLLLVFVLSCMGCSRNEAKDSAQTYTELKSENSSLDKNYKNLVKAYEAEKDEYEKLKDEFEQYKEKMKPYEAKANN